MSDANLVQVERTPDGRARCPSCGAIVAENSPMCGFCHSELAWAAPSAEPTTASVAGAPAPAEQPPQARMVDRAICPRGHGDLVAMAVGRAWVHGCPTCAGVFIEMQSIPDATSHAATIEELTARANEAMASASVEVDGRKMVYLKCPACQGATARRNFEKVSGVMVDTCNTHGTWFDAGEYPQAMEFLQSGGQAKRIAFEAREADHLQRQRKAIKDIERHTNNAPLSGHHGGFGGFGNPGDW